MVTLKSYQQAALDALRAFARLPQLKGPALAFSEPVWGRNSGKRCLVSQIVKERDGLDMAGQREALLA